MKTLAKLLYVEADEEITDLVDRLRDLSLEDAVTFVVPERSRALQSAMSFRLLKRYADSYGKHVNVISSDPRLQALSLETGFSAFPSLAAYDGGVEVHRPSTEPDQLGTEVPAFVPPPAGRRQAAIMSAAPKGPVPPASSFVRAPPPLRDYRPYLVAAAIVAVLGLLALILYVPAAAVTLSVQGTPLKTDIQLIGSPTTPAGATDGFITQAIHASESQTVPGTPSGQKSIAAAPASGAVVFTNQTFLPVDVPKRTVSTADGVKFKTQQDATNIPPFSSSKPIPVVALSAGANGNVGVGQITVH